MTELLLPDWPCSRPRSGGSVSTEAGPPPAGVSSGVQNHRPQQILLAGADGGDGAVVELKGRPPVHHHAGVPAARAHAQPAAAGKSEALTHSHTHTHAHPLTHTLS